MARRRGYMKFMQRKFSASETTIQAKIDDLDVGAIEAQTENEFELRIIDPPIVNGVDLRQHPNAQRRKYFNSILDAGGKIAGMFTNEGRLVSLMPTTDENKIGKNAEDFRNSELNHYNRVNSMKIERAIREDFEPHPGKERAKKRPKEMTPEDFWIQFNRRSMDKILDSTDQTVIDFVAYINSQSIVDMKDKEVKKGIKYLRKNEYIRKREFSEVEE